MPGIGPENCTPERHLKDLFLFSERLFVVFSGPAAADEGRMTPEGRHPHGIEKRIDFPAALSY